MDPSERGRGGVRSEINVTPLVDVCLVLLIIFMVVTPLLGNGPAELPETSHPAKLGERRDDIVVTVERDHSLLIDEKPIAAGTLKSALRDARDGGASRQLVVRADRVLPYRKVREVLRAANESGFAGAGLATRVKKDAIGSTASSEGGRPWR